MACAGAPFAFPVVMKGDSEARVSATREPGGSAAETALPLDARPPAGDRVPTTCAKAWSTLAGLGVVLSSLVAWRLGHLATLGVRDRQRCSCSPSWPRVSPGSPPLSPRRRRRLRAGVDARIARRARSIARDLEPVALSSARRRRDRRPLAALTAAATAADGSRATVLASGHVAGDPDPDSDAIERLYDRGVTDGLPVVPPTRRSSIAPSRLRVATPASWWRWSPPTTAARRSRRSRSTR